MTTEAERAAREVAPVCPRCDQGQVFPATILPTGERIQVCEECDATWPVSGVLTPTSFRDLGAVLEERGLSPLWDELDVPGLARLHRPQELVRSAQVPQPVLVTGTVTRHEPYGFYLDIGLEQDGLVPIVAIEDDPTAPAALPRVGRTVEAALLGRTELRGQPRLSIRPSDLAGARRTHDEEPPT